jgi:hypothetical protein
MVLGMYLSWGFSQNILFECGYVQSRNMFN